MTSGDGPLVLIAGGGIAGLSLALTLHEIGIRCQVFEAVTELRPLGVGINLQPNAIRELQQLGLGDSLDDIGIRTRRVSFYSKHGGLIWSEDRGTWAGYKWPQYSLHRGKLQMLLYDSVRERLGPDAISTGARVTGYTNTPSGVDASITWSSGRKSVEAGSVLVGADGIHSALRAQMYPDEGEPKWAGTVMWRATTQAPPFLDGQTMIFIGNDSQKIVAYPLTAADADSGLATINWIAEHRFDPAVGFNKEDYTRSAPLDAFLPPFDSWRYDWFDLQALAEGAEKVFEYPMVDRDPIPSWTDGRVTLMGDAAHVMYPVGSNGASQAIVDARKIGRAFVDRGVGSAALLAFEEEMRPATSAMVITNRSAGPDHIMQLVEDRCGGVFDEVTDVMPYEELQAFASRFKKSAGFAITELNASEPIIRRNETHEIAKLTITD